MHIINNTKIYKLSNSVKSEFPDYDYLIVNSDLNLSELITSKQELIFRFLLQGKSAAQAVATLALHTGEFEIDYVNKTVNHWQKIGLFNAKPKSKISSWTWIEVIKTDSSTVLKTFIKLRPVSILFFIICSLISLYGAFLLITGTRPHPSDLPSWQLVFLLSWVSLAAHEVGHLLALSYFKLPAHKIGLSLYFGLPMLFVDTTSGWSLNKFRRILISIAGPFLNFTIGLLCVILWNVFPGNAGLLYAVANANLLMLILSLFPFLKMDGYYILTDLLQITKLEEKSFALVKTTFEHPGKAKLSLKNIGYMFYFAIYVFAAIGISIYATRFWYHLFISKA